ncbi:adenylate/guanylate cyclase domain-containing protein [Desulfocicer vacuolatum]|uniref:adenylate/guanylate cyclase domain-containing protein n=1 Tax=Desulfocicer vacuolatum TaxID=2298 RepID=UPI001E55DE09|nr:adenylate/guanylate cyclase domain-containing protein [Desulfocicer vacuolatum]
MKTGTVSKLNTLQGRLFVFVLLPVFSIILIWGVASFLYTRDAMIEQWKESAVLKLQRAAHLIEMRMLRPVELIELMYKTIPSGQSPLFNEMVTLALEDLDGVVKVTFSYAGKKSPLPMKTFTGMPWKQMRAYRHSRVVAVSHPEYDADAAGTTFTLLLNLLDDQKQMVGRLELTMRFSALMDDLHLDRMEWFRHGMACIVDSHQKFLFHTDSTMVGRNFLGDSNDPLELAILKSLEDKAHGTVAGEGHPPQLIAGFYKLDNVPWTIIIYGRGEDILKPIIQYRNLFGMSGVFIICLVIFLIRTHGLKLTTNIRRLCIQARHVARGEYGEPIHISSRDEMGMLVENFNAMVEGLKERDFIRNSFGRYVDPEFARQLMQQPDAGQLGGVRKEVVVMMSDIRGFTRMAEGLSPETTIDLLNAYFSLIIEIIDIHKGIIVDFLGDGILVFFEPGSSSLAEKSMVDTLQNAIRCAVKMQQQMIEFNRDVKAKGIPEIHMGIGVHMGPVIVGNLGSETRKKYGIVGSAVNLTSRIQGTALGEEIVISDAVYCHLKGDLKVCRSFESQFKGIDDPVLLHVLASVHHISNSKIKLQSEPGQ